MTREHPHEPSRTEDSFRPTSRTTLSIVAALTVTLVVVGLVTTRWPRVADRVFGDREVAADAPLDEQCRSVPDSARRVTLTGVGGHALGGAVVGSAGADTVVVLRHGASQTLCNWLDWADELVDGTGVRVVLFDRRGQGSSPGEAGLAHEPTDLARVVSWAAGDRGDDVVLVASSMGNSVAVAALEEFTEPVCALVSVSPVLTSSDSSGRVNGRSPRDGLPGSVFVTWETGNPGVVDNAEHLTELATSLNSVVETLPVDADDHSLALVENHDEVRDFVTDAVASCA